MGVRIERSGSSWVLETEVSVPRPLEAVFPFFADAANLQTLTPDFLGFEILTPQPIAMEAGAIIDYRIRLSGIPMRWRTRIAAWEPPHRFVDEQVRGPYRTWIHEHTFESRGAWTVCRDRVEYALLCGRLVHGWFVAPRLRDIFAFRHEAMLEAMAPIPRGVAAPLEAGNSGSLSRL